MAPWEKKKNVSCLDLHTFPMMALEEVGDEGDVKQMRERDVQKRYDGS